MPNLEQKKPQILGLTLYSSINCSLESWVSLVQCLHFHERFKILAIQPRAQVSRFASASTLAQCSSERSQQLRDMSKSNPMCQFPVRRAVTIVLG